MAVVVSDFPARYKRFQEARSQIVFAGNVMSAAAGVMSPIVTASENTLAAHFWTQLRIVSLPVPCVDIRTGSQPRSTRDKQTHTAIAISRDQRLLRFRRFATTSSAMAYGTAS